jgi:hypothetical protein
LFRSLFEAKAKGALIAELGVRYREFPCELRQGGEFFFS